MSNFIYSLVAINILICIVTQVSQGYASCKLKCAKRAVEKEREERKARYLVEL